MFSGKKTLKMYINLRMEVCETSNKISHGQQLALFKKMCSLLDFFVSLLLL